MDPEPVAAEQPDTVPQAVQEDPEVEAEHEGISQNFQGDPEPETGEKELFNQAFQIDPEHEVEHGVSLQGGQEPEIGEQEQGNLQILQVDPEPEIKQEERAPQAVKRGLEPESTNQDEERCPEPEVEQEKASRVFQAFRREILPQMSHRSIMLMASGIFRSSWEDARTDILQYISQHNIVPMACELLRPSWEEARREILQHISQYNIEPMAFELLRPSWEEIRREILSLNFEQVEFRIARQELNTYQRNQTALLEHILRLLFRVQFGTLTQFSSLEALPQLALEAPPQLLALESPPPMLVQENPLYSSNLQGQSLPSFLEGRRYSSVLDSQPLTSILNAQSLLSAPDVRSLLSAPDVRSLLSNPTVRSLLSTPTVRSLLSDPAVRSLLSSPRVRSILLTHSDRSHMSVTDECVALSKENVIYTGLQKRKRADLQEPSESVRAREPAETLAVRPKKTKKGSSRKHQQRTEFLDPGEPDASLDPAELQKLLEYENQDEIPDPGEPNFSEPIELFNYLNYGEMIAGGVELQPLRDPEMEYLRDMENEDDDDLYSDVCQPFIPPAAQPPNQDEVIDIESDDAEEDAPCAAAPNSGGSHSNGRCRDGESKMEEKERKKDENYPKEMQEFVMWLFGGILLFLITGNVLNVLSYIYDWRGLRTHTTLIPVIVNVTTQMTTTIFNANNSDFDETTSMNDFTLNMTDMDL